MTFTGRNDTRRRHLDPSHPARAPPKHPLGSARRRSEGAIKLIGGRRFLNAIICFRVRRRTVSFLTICSRNPANQVRLLGGEGGGGVGVRSGGGGGGGDQEKSHVCAAMSRMNRGGLPQKRKGGGGDGFLNRQEEEEEKNRKKMKRKIFPAIFFLSLPHNLRSARRRITGGCLVIMLPQSIISSTSRGGAVSEI